MDEELFERTCQSGAPAEALPALQALRLRTKASGDPFLLVHLLARVARCQSRLGRFEEASETLNDIDFVLVDARRRLPGADPRKAGRAQAMSLLERARLFHHGGWPDNARDLLQACMAQAEHWQDPGLIQEAQALLLDGSGG